MANDANQTVIKWKQLSLVGVLADGEQQANLPIKAPKLSDSPSNFP